MKKTAIILALALMTVPIMSGCGIKPKNIDPPEGANEGDFPRVYPEDKTDPAADAAKIVK